MWYAIRSQFWPAWHRQIAAALLLAMIGTEITGDSSRGGSESHWLNWFEYPFIFWPYSFGWFVLFVRELWNPGPFTRIRYCWLWVFLGLYVYGIVRVPYAFFSGPFPSLS